MARELQLFFKELNDHKIIHPQELLELFKKYAPHALTQKEAKLIFEELGTYLTEEEAHKLFLSWERLHLENEPGFFYGIMHELSDKYAV